jgi:ParB family chromosome partitioning protein
LVADLPAPVVECFRSPLEIQHRHAKSIAAALETDRKGVLRRAEKIRAHERPKAAAAVVAALIGAHNEVTEPTHQPLEIDGKLVGHWSRDGAGRLTIQIEAAYVNDHRHLTLLKAITAALKQ